MSFKIFRFLSHSTLLTVVFCSLIFNSQAQIPTTSKYITIDQFGYLPHSQKVAVIRNPEVGFDAAESFVLSGNYAVINATDSSRVFTGKPTVWGGGKTDDSSGDKAWWFDFRN